MAVAETSAATSTKNTARSLNLGLASLGGGVVLLAGLGLIFGTLPWGWRQVIPKQVNEFLSGALLLLAGLVAIALVLTAWYKLDQKFARPGLRGGSFVAAATIFFAAWLIITIGNVIDGAEHRGDAAGMIGTLLLAGIVLVGVFSFLPAMHSIVGSSDSKTTVGSPSRPSKATKACASAARRCWACS